MAKPTFLCAVKGCKKFFQTSKAATLHECVEWHCPKCGFSDRSDVTLLTSEIEVCDECFFDERMKLRNYFLLGGQDV